jgi:hypothetical protein
MAETAPGAGFSDSNQQPAIREQREAAGAAGRFGDGGMVTSGSFEEVGCLAGSGERHELAAGSDMKATAEKEGWMGVSYRLLAGGGE